MDLEKLFNDLESNNSQEFEEAKRRLSEFFHQTKDAWLVHGMMDYFLKTSSVRIVEVLVKVQPPHDKHIFDRLLEWVRTPNRITALSLFGFIIRKHPTWLHKVAKHTLLKDVLKLLQTEKEIIPLMSALLCMITLLPIIPNLVQNFLNDLFDVFGHLASWNMQNSSRSLESQLIHLQIGLYMLFHRLYGMYPCNFLHYIRKEFILKEKMAIFQHTIKPLLETVRIHPMLVTSNRESECNPTRWKEMEPHDVVVECAKLSLGYCQDNSECFAHSSALRTQESCVETPVSIQLRNSVQNVPFRSNPGVTSPFYSIMLREKISSGDSHKFESIWSPSIEILATPPPAGSTVPHTPTPTPMYGVPTVSSTIATVHGGSGASPPEAAVEATPETTPMKDTSIKRAMAANSPVVRAILGGSSQPSSPMRKENSPFRFPDVPLNSVTSQRLIDVLNDRTSYHLQLIKTSSQEEAESTQFALSLQDLQISSAGNILKGNLQSLESPSTQEDQEVLELTSQILGGGGPHHSDTLQDISAECDDCDETERSPCSAGGLHVPTSKSMRMLAGRMKRSRVESYCVTEHSSYSTLQKEMQMPLVRRAKSWPAIEKQLSQEENSLDVDLYKTTNIQPNGDSSSPSVDDVMSAATHFKNLQEREVTIVSLKQPKRIVQLTKSCAPKTPVSCVAGISFGTQTLEQWPQIYEHNLLELFVDLNKVRTTADASILKPYEILDQYIERTIKLKQQPDMKNREEYLRDQIQLLNLQLQYERYRRDIHAERNRRLLGRSRTNRALEVDNERLKLQVHEMQKQIQSLIAELNGSRRNFTAREQEIQQECNLWKTKHNSEVEENKKLRLKIENLQHRLSQEQKARKEIDTELQVTHGELFDTRNDMRQAQLQAELGCQYKEELSKLQCEFLVMGEIQIKCRDKLSEMDNLKGRDDELNLLQKSYGDETKELRSSLESKSAQLEAARIRLAELQSILSNKEVLFTDQKRLLKFTKEEYEEKFKALQKKYDSQKAILLQMEERIVDLYKTQTAVNLATCSPESERADIGSSSPYSISLASSEGLSASLRSFDFRNLQTIAQPNTAMGAAAMSDSAMISSTATISNASQTANANTASSFRMPTNNQSQYHQMTQQQHHPQIHQQTSASASSSSNVTSRVSGSRSTAFATVNSSPSTSTGRNALAALDIPVPGPSHHPHHRHHNNPSPPEEDVLHMND